jgi:protocatechuate 3,4-dioxygenase beta subunit
MPRFYFDVRKGTDLVRDEEGLEFPDLASAEREAEDAAASLVRKLKHDGEPIKITIEVRDESGTRLTGASATFHVERGLAAIS